MNSEVVSEFLEKMKRLSPEDRAQMIKYMEDLLNYQWRCVYPAAVALGKGAVQ